MSISAENIGSDYKGNKVAQEYYCKEDTRVGAIMYTEALRDFRPFVRTFINDEFGSAMNQGVAFSGDPEKVYDGQDLALWTVSTVVGNAGDFDETSTDHAHGGVVTIDDYTGLSGDTIQINGAGITNTTLTEGVEWIAATSNNDTATSLADAITAIDGVSATVTTNVIIVTADLEADITTFAESNSADMPSTAQCIAAISSENDDVVQFAKGSEVTIDDYTAATGWIYLTGWSTGGTKGVNIFCYDDSGGTSIGDELNIGNYISTTTFGVWQKFTIPLSDFNLTTLDFDAIRVRTVDIGSGAPPNYFLDDLQVEESGKVLDFLVESQGNDYIKIHSIRLVIVGLIAGTLADGTKSNIVYDSFLSIPRLTNGVVFQTEHAHKVSTSLTIRGVDDFMIVGCNTVGDFSDGTNSMLVLEIAFPDPIILKGKDSGKLRIRINDDLSGLTEFKASVRGSIQTIV